MTHTDDPIPVRVARISRVSTPVNDPNNPWTPRRLDVYCDGGHDRDGAALHQTVFLATLATRRGGLPHEERWFVVDGSPHGVTDALIHPDDASEYASAPGIVELSGRVAERSKITCPVRACGLHITTGGVLSKGFAEVIAARKSGTGFGGLTAGESIHPARRQLSALVDHGASNLALSTLVRILSV